MANRKMKKEVRRKSKIRAILGILLIIFVMLFLILSGLQFVAKKERGLQNKVTNPFYTIKNVDIKECHENENYLINGKNATIYLLFNRLEDYFLNYTLQKNDSSIYIISKKHPTGIIGIPERKHILFEDCIEINLTLPFGEYRIFVDGAQLNKTLQIEPTEKELTYCEKDEDCIKIDSDCCGCSSGGDKSTAMAINKNYLSYTEEEHRINCRGVYCIAEASKDWTCWATPKCVSGKCKLVQK
jgi:hypothetical protein